MEHLHQEPQSHFSPRPLHRRVKQRFVEVIHDSRDGIAHAQSAIKNYSGSAVQKIIDRPLPYLLAASALGFLLSSMFRHHHK
ncbi:hypothetical protein ACNVED_02180 [Legionella sp. D16C41]|uniref:hypothetical protein n=1 Tax=Legionella sp. D16C41 TaxID=3402688 RepID=UPI003AF57AA0